VREVFVDTNILLDVLLERPDFWAESARVWNLCETGRLAGFVSAISYNNCHYIIGRLKDGSTADRAVRLIVDTFRTVALDERLVHKALDAPLADFEDAVQYHAAIQADVDCLMTRNINHFPRNTDLPVLTPREFLQLWQSQDFDKVDPLV
jgi:predicted nucleic acid-binding protein